MEIYQFDQPFIKKLIDTGYQHISLSNGEGKKIISFNPQKKDFQKKIDEIKKRFAVLPDGLYQLLLNWNYGGAGSPDTFLIKKGNQPIESIQPAIITKPQVLKESNNVLSYDQALENISTIANLQAINRELTNENIRLNKELDSLESELKEYENKPLSEGSGMDSQVGSWLKEIAPMLTPIADRYFDTENRRLSIQERDQYFKFGKQKPRVKQRSQAPPPPQAKNYPDPNDPDQLNKFFDELESLDENEFLQAMQIIKNENPALYEITEREFTNEENENENENLNAE